MVFCWMGTSLKSVLPDCPMMCAEEVDKERDFWQKQRAVDKEEEDERTRVAAEKTARVVAAYNNVTAEVKRVRVELDSKTRLANLYHESLLLAEARLEDRAVENVISGLLLLLGVVTFFLWTMKGCGRSRIESRHSSGSGKRKGRVTTQVAVRGFRCRKRLTSKTSTTADIFADCQRSKNRQLKNVSDRREAVKEDSSDDSISWVKEDGCGCSEPQEQRDEIRNYDDRDAARRVSDTFVCLKELPENEHVKEGYKSPSDSESLDTKPKDPAVGAKGIETSGSGQVTGNGAGCMSGDEGNDSSEIFEFVLLE